MTKKMWQIEASVDDPTEQALLTNTIANDSMLYRRFDSIEKAHNALDDFCERKGLPLSSFNVQDVAA
jgi:molybdopterin/thiamine biosynthesis adenylyltransferase